MVGYYFWGFLGDKKYNIKGEEISTPDGNAFYSWSIINELLNRGKSVVALSEDRDLPGFKKEKANLFNSFAKDNRYYSYIELLDREETDFEDLEYAIIEWRWIIEGRNDANTKINNPENYQPDYENMVEIINKLNENGIPFVVFDLDYKLTVEDIIKFKIKYVIELGDKWENDGRVKSSQVKIPFDFSHINDMPIKTALNKSLVYIGNRYERDWCIDKYIPENVNDCIVYGNWKESGRDSEERWKNINFGHRLQTSEMYEAYSNSIATVLLAKNEYCQMGFMTARIIEAVFYGCVPFFIEEYGRPLIKEYAGQYEEFLRVSSKRDLTDKINILKNNLQIRKDIILYLRKHLRFMDAKFFIDDVEELIYDK